MSSVEYIAILASILLGLAIADQATSLHRLIRAGPKVQWHWLPVLLAVIVLLAVLQFWWASYRTWMAIDSIGEFLIPMAQLLVLFLLASATLPDEVPEEGVNLRSYYFETHRYAWALFAAYVASAIALQLLGGTVNWINVASFLVMCALAVWKKPWIHYVGLPLISVVPLIFFLRLEIAH